MSWQELSDKQLRYVYQLIASDFSTDEVKTMCLLHWSGLKVIARKDSDTFLLKKGKIHFEVTPLTIAELLPFLSWIDTPPSAPVRIGKINRQTALPADFSEVPFETYIIVDNLYQGYLQTQNETMLDELASVLYGKPIRLKPYERVNVLYWVISLKAYFAEKYPDFYQPADNAAGGNLLGSATPNVEEAMNAQIRALTKGDITKEKEILSLDTWRALTELNAQAREYKELNAQLNKK